MGLEEIKIGFHAIHRYGLKKYGGFDYHLGRNKQLERELREELKSAVKTNIPPKVLLGKKRGKRAYRKSSKKEVRKIRYIWENEDWYFGISNQGLQTIIKKEKHIMEKIDRWLKEH